MTEVWEVVQRDPDSDKAMIMVSGAQAWIPPVGKGLRWVLWQLHCCTLLGKTQSFISEKNFTHLLEEETILGCESSLKLGDLTVWG